MKFSVEIAQPAFFDAALEHAYIALDSPESADRWLEGLFEAIISLDDHPRRGRKAIESRTLRRDIRQLLYMSHRILYSIKGRTVRVLFIQHAARRPRRR